MRTLTISALVFSFLYIFSVNNAAANSSPMKKEKKSQQEHKRPCPPPFSQLDIDQNGGITLDEFSQHKIPRGKHDEVFAKIDSNNDGVITNEELRSHKPPQPRKHH